MDQPRRFGDRYELGGVLGRGGMAEVYQGRDIRLGRTVAVKTLRADLARDPTFQARFRREAQSAASLNHPSIVAVYDTGEDMINGIPIPYIVMEYVDGHTLRELLHSGRRLLPERALEITAGILQALAYSHRAGIIHRDIKPANVMLTRTGGVKVMDFGIARALADSGMTMTQTAAVIGTAQYLSPEQARGETVDPRSDLYSTGCLLYELLVQRPPFIGDSPVAVAYQHVREEPQPPSALDPEITPVIDAIVLRALAKHPDNRYQNADEMRLDIERSLEGQPVSAPTMLLSQPPAAATRQMAATQMLSPSAPTAVAPPAGPTGYSPGGPPPSRRDERRDERERGGKAGWWILAALCVIAIVAAFFVTRTLMGHNSPTAQNTASPPGAASTTPPPSTTPSPTPTMIGIPSDLNNKTFNDAYNELNNLGFTNIVQKGQTSSSVQQGFVVNVNPTAGTQAAPTQTITLYVSTGPQKVSVPSVVGTDVNSAKSQLSSVGLNANVTYQPSSQPANQVLSQSVPGGTQEPSGTTIFLTVSSGPPQTPTAAPTTSSNPNPSTTPSSPGGILSSFCAQPQNRNDPFCQSQSGGH